MYGAVRSHPERAIAIVYSRVEKQGLKQRQSKHAHPTFACIARGIESYAVAPSWLHVLLASASPASLASLASLMPYR